MSRDEYLRLWQMIGNLWSRETDPAAVAEAETMFQDLSFRDARTAVKDLFAQGLEHPPNASVLFTQTKDVQRRRLREEEEERKAREARALPASTDSLKAFASTHNGYTPTQVFRYGVAGKIEEPAYPEFHDPEKGVPPLAHQKTPVIVRDSKEAALPVGDRDDPGPRRHLPGDEASR